MKSLMKAVAVCAAVVCGVASPALAWEPGLKGGKLSYAPSSTEAKTLLPETTQDYLSPHVASLWNKPEIQQNNIMWVYTGWIYLDGAYAFGSYFDDSAQLTLDGELLFGYYNNWTTYRTATVTKPAGWYPIEIRLGNTSGGAGADGVYVTNPDTQKTELCGFGYKKLAEGESAPTANSKASMKFYQKLEDDGTGSLLRCDVKMQMEVSAALDAANGKIVVSTFVHKAEEGSALEAIVKRSDGVTTTNTIATAVVASETPYTYEVTNIEGGLAYEIVVRLVGPTGFLEEITTVIYVGEVGVVSVSDADVTKDQLGSFRIFRGTSETAVAYDLVVNYTIGGTAVMGRDYVEIPLSVTIPAGESELLVLVDTLCNMAMPDGMTVTLTLGTGGYVPDPAAASATIGIAKPDMHRDWVYDLTDKTLSDGLWTFNATVSSGSLTVGTLKKTCYKSGPLDFTKPVSSGETITGIGAKALQNCTALAEVLVNDDVTSIGNSCFAGCSSLTNFTPALPTRIVKLGEYAFQGCGKLTGEFVIGRGVENCTVGGRAFQSSGITSVRFAGSVKTVPEYCFEWCYNLTNAVLEEGVQAVDPGAFQSSALTHVRLPEKSLKTLARNCLRTRNSGDARCGWLVSVEPFLPTSITTLGDRVFCQSFATAVEPSMDELVLQNRKADITLAEGWQFEGASATKKVTLGRGITKLPNGFLQSMKSVNELRFGCPYPPYTGTPFLHWSARQACVYVPAEEKGWMDFLTNTTYVTPWKGTDDVPGVSDALKTEFATKFPGYPRPFGLTTTSAMFGSQWIYKVNPPGMMIIIQ